MYLRLRDPRPDVRTAMVEILAQLPADELAAVAPQLLERYAVQLCVRMYLSN